MSTARLTQYLKKATYRDAKKEERAEVDGTVTVTTPTLPRTRQVAQLAGETIAAATIGHSVATIIGKHSADFAGQYGRDTFPGYGLVVGMADGFYYNVNAVSNGTANFRTLLTESVLRPASGMAADALYTTINSYCGRNLEDMCDLERGFVYAVGGKFIREAAGILGDGAKEACLLTAAGAKGLYNALASRSKKSADDKQQQLLEQDPEVSMKPTV